MTKAQIKKVLKQIEEAQKNIVFDDILHKYWVNGKEVISTTQLLKKHKITASYDGVNQEVLDAARERGNEIHAEIEGFIKMGIKGESYEFEQFLKLIELNDLTPLLSEFRVGNEIVAGTADILVLNNETNELGIVDIKTGVFLKNAVEWQTSIYGVLGKLPITFIGCLHLPKIERGNCSYKQCTLKTAMEVEELLLAEQQGTIYTENKNETALQTFDNKLVEQAAELERAIKVIESQAKDLKAKQAELKTTLIEEMKNNNLKTIDFGGVQITYVAPTKRKGLDTKAIEAELPEVYEKYRTETNVSESLKITIREDK